MWTRLCYGKKDKPFNYSEFICDSKEDLIELPTNKSPSSVNKNILSCSVGSIAFCISEKQFFILNNINEWKLFKDNNVNVDAINEVLDNSNENIYKIINLMLSEIVGEVK